MCRTFEISGEQKLFFLIALISLLIIQSPEIYGQEDNSYSDVEFLDIKIKPETIQLGDSIIVFATVINNSDDSITFQAGCNSPIWLEFLTDNVESIASPACQAEGYDQLEQGQSKTVKAPREGLLYKAISAGTIEAEVNFRYTIKDPTQIKTISKIIILKIDSKISLESEGEKKEIPPRKQVLAGINPQDVICSNELQLIFKSTDGSPACVKNSTAEKLIKRGWAKK